MCAVVAVVAVLETVEIRCGWTQAGRAAIAARSSLRTSGQPAGEAANGKVDGGLWTLVALHALDAADGIAAGVPPGTVRSAETATHQNGPLQGRRCLPNPN